MGTNKKPTPIYSLLLVLFIFTIPMYAQVNTDYLTISGVVKDKRTKKNLEYVSVSVPGTNIGTITNADGEFSIKIKKSHNAKAIKISHIGYINFITPIEGLDMNHVAIFLTTNEKELTEIVIQPVDPLSLIKEAIMRIGDNYSPKPNLLTGFYRETVKKGRNYINISEAVMDIYKTSYKEDTQKEKVQIFKGRKLLSPKISDTLIVKLMGGPNSAINLDIIKNSDDYLLDPETLYSFAYEMGATTTIDERPHYTIHFKPIVIMPYALYWGTYYIDKETLTFSRIEFSLDVSDKNKATQAMLIRKPPKLHFKPEQASFLVTYKQRDGLSYLNYVRSDTRFKCDWKKRFFFFSTNYEVVSEMVVTDRKEQNIESISNKESFKKNQSLADNVSNFADANFWEDFNIIEPTESLESAVTKLRKKSE